MREAGERLGVWQSAVWYRLAGARKKWRGDTEQNADFAALTSEA